MFRLNKVKSNPHYSLTFVLFCLAHFISFAQSNEFSILKKEKVSSIPAAPGTPSQYFELEVKDGEVVEGAFVALRIFHSTLNKRYNKGYTDLRNLSIQQLNFEQFRGQFTSQTQKKSSRWTEEKFNGYISHIDTNSTLTVNDSRKKISVDEIERSESRWAFYTLKVLDNVQGGDGEDLIGLVVNLSMGKALLLSRQLSTE